MGSVLLLGEAQGVAGTQHSGPRCPSSISALPWCLPSRPRLPISEWELGFPTATTHCSPGHQVVLTTALCRPRASSACSCPPSFPDPESVSLPVPRSSQGTGV